MYIFNISNCFPKAGCKKKKVDKDDKNPSAGARKISDNDDSCSSNSVGESSAGLSEMSSQQSHPLPMPDPSWMAEKTRIGNGPQLPTESQILSSPDLKTFLYSELSTATGGFHPDYHLGEGGFGNVYKGWLHKETLAAATPDSGMAVAVKKLKTQGLQGHKEWLSEVHYLGRLHHINLVKLIGFCLEGDNRLLVYEFMPNGSLESHLFRTKEETLPWAKRMKIAVQAARGLCFLHESKSQVIYRDFKASNILLDPEFNAKLSDFGLAKTGPTGDQSHVITAVMGTEGYADPEYIRTGRLSAKCDVYSFGVVLFELLTGRRAVDYSLAKHEHHLVRWVKPHLRDKRTLVRIMDRNLEGQYPRRGAFVAATLALHCINAERRFRPTMREVLEYLEQLESPKFMTIKSPCNQSIQSSSAPVSPAEGFDLSPKGKDTGAWSPISRTPRLSSPHSLLRSFHKSSRKIPSPPLSKGNAKFVNRSRFSGIVGYQEDSSEEQYRSECI